jgi:YVTN family beta-propeller protein
MRVLFSPINLRGLTLPNRIVVSPMCQYVAEEGKATTWHLIHLGAMALSGAGLLCIEATAVEAEGRITAGDLGLWNDVTDEVFDAIRAEVPADKPVGVKVSATDWVENGWDVAQTIAFARELKQRGVGWISVSSGGISPLKKIVLGPGYQVTISPDDKTAYVANPQTNDVSVVDIKSLKEVARVPVGFAPSRNTAWLAP